MEICREHQHIPMTTTKIASETLGAHSEADGNDNAKQHNDRASDDNAAFECGGDGDRQHHREQPEATQQSGRAPAGDGGELFDGGRLRWWLPLGFCQ